MATNEQVIAFIKELGNLAVAECNRRAAAGLGFVVPSICIAQAGWETGYGTAGLMTKANAYFGIKAGGSWTGKVYSASTWEVVNGVEYNTVANFRAYDNKIDSVRDYYDLIVNNPRYSKGVSYVDKMLTSYDTIYNIWAGGYATDTNYVSDIMGVVNYRKLDQWNEKVNAADAVPDESGGIYIPNHEYILPDEVSEQEFPFKFVKI